MEALAPQHVTCLLRRLTATEAGFPGLQDAGPDHHIFGFVSSTDPGYHHSCFEVPSIDAIESKLEPRNI